MDLASQVINTVALLGKPVHLIPHEKYILIQCGDQVYINLIPLHNNHTPEDLLELQTKYDQEHKVLVHLWEDVWNTNQAGVLSRIKSFLGLNQTFHARKCKIVEVSKEQATSFFNTYHLQGFVKAKYYYGLTLEGELVSLASFSELRPMKLKAADYMSAELIRFASKEGSTITGGLSKLIKFFLNNNKPNDLMSYADRDWSLGKGYEHLGFELSAITPPRHLYVDLNTGLRYFPHRIPKKLLLAFHEQKELNLDDYLSRNAFAKVFNIGNLKYHLYV